MKTSLFHITTRTEATAAKSQGDYTPVNYKDEGFIHCSYANQVSRVAENFYKGQQDLVLLEIDKALVDVEVIDEDLYESGEEFPHIYGILAWQAVNVVHDFPCLDDGSFELPKAISLS